MGVSATLSGLLPGTTYHYRLVATNADGTSAGADATFTAGGGAMASIGPGPVKLTKGNKVPVRVSCKASSLDSLCGGTLVLKTAQRVGSAKSRGVSPTNGAARSCSASASSSSRAARPAR